MNTLSSAAAPVIEVRNLVRLYGLKANQWALTPSQRVGKPTPANPGFAAVNDINFDVNEGEVFGLLGTNGAGKSSTLEVLEGLARPSSGTVRLFGMDPVKHRDKIRPLTGIMLQNGGLPQELTVVETLNMWAGISTNPRAVKDVLKDVELTHRENNKVGSLSGGEQRRVDLACALLNNPRLLFLDEPTTGLDPESRANTWELLARLKAQGVTMVLTTHYLEEAERLCDRIAIMHRGKIEIEGTQAQLIAEQPAEITFKMPTQTTAMPAASSHGEVPSLPQGLQGVVSQVGDTVRISTHALQDDSFHILSWAAAHRLSLPDFRANPANLESIFMRIAGRII